MSSENPLHQEMAAAWDVVARAKYRAEFDENVRLLRDGGHNLLEPELAVLAPLLPGASVIQLQCSHGLDALGLLNLGAKHVVGIDLSREMIDQAAEKAERAGLETAEFICADAIKPALQFERDGRPRVHGSRFSTVAVGLSTMGARCCAAPERRRLGLHIRRPPLSISMGS